MEVQQHLFANTRQNFIYWIECPQEDANIEDEDENDSSATCVSFIDEALLPRQKNLPKFFAQRLRRMAVTLASITLVVTLVIAVLAFLTWRTSDSAAAFGFAFDSFFTSLSSFMIIWRFCSSQSSITESARKETIATLVIALSLVISAVFIFARAYQSIQAGDKPSQLVFILVLSVSSCLAYFLLFVAKYKVAIRMGSGALMTDAIDALSGGILAFSLVISSTILKCSIDVWYLDSSIAMAIAAFSVCYGGIVMMRLIVVYRDREDATIVRHYLDDRF